VIIGSGPAGLTAAIYAARAKLCPLLFEGFASGGPPGGQLMATTEVENFPGFSKGIGGIALVEEFKEQAKRFGTEMLLEDVVKLHLREYPFVVEGSKSVVAAESVIIATGARARRLYVPGTHDGELWQKGVTACAVCDGAMPIFRNKPLYVIGGGDTALEEALFLTRYGSHLFIVHRRDQFRASRVMVEQVERCSRITVIWNHILSRVEGEEVVSAVVLAERETGQLSRHEAGGVFFAIGHDPNTSFLPEEIDRDAQGYLITHSGTKTSVEGVFAAGDVQDKQYRQAVTAASSGCMAALDVERWLIAKQKRVSA